MSAVEWVRVGVQVIGMVFSVGMSLLQVYIMYRVFRWYAYEKPGIRRGDPAAPNVLLRRLFCKHRVIARVKDPWGRQYTGCAACGTDVNAGKRREDWR